jgi:hypothetical protein
MIITRAEALAKLNHPDNPFSPSRRGGDDWGRVVEVIDVPGSSPSTPKEPDDTAPQPSPQANPTNAEIKSILAQVNPAVARDRSRGDLRGKIPIQAAIGETSLLVGPKIAGALFDRSLPQTMAYEGAHGHWKSMVGAESGPPKPELVERLDAFKEKLAYAAGRVLAKTLDNLDADKIDRMKKATNISRVAKDMAVIMDKVSKNNNDEGAVHFHIHRPEIRSVNDYNTVRINTGTVIDSSSQAQIPSGLSSIIAEREKEILDSAGT